MELWDLFSLICVFIYISQCIKPSSWTYLEPCRSARRWGIREWEARRSSQLQVEANVRLQNLPPRSGVSPTHPRISFCVSERGTNCLFFLSVSLQSMCSRSLIMKPTVKKKKKSYLAKMILNNLKFMFVPLLLLLLDCCLMQHNCIYWGDCVHYRQEAMAETYIIAAGDNNLRRYSSLQALLLRLLHWSTLCTQWETVTKF